MTKRDLIIPLGRLLDDITLDIIESRAIRVGVTVPEMVRRLIAAGLARSD